MNYLKLVLTLAFVLLLSAETFAVVINNPNTVGVPLDGGLLTLLAGAGIAYFAARKKKRAGGSN